MIDCRNRKTHRVDLAEKVAVIGERNGLVEAGDLLGSGFLDVDDTDQLDTRQLCIQPRVMLAEVSDTDDCHLHEVIPPPQSRCLLRRPRGSDLHGRS